MKKYLATISYIAAIVVLNMAVVYLPHVAAFGESFSPADVLVGLIYLVRDFAQREIRHYIFAAMIIGASLSYVLATPDIALASASAFIVGECIDWSLFTFTKKPLSQRLLLSAIVSSPFDSVVFLYVSGRFHWLPVVVMTLGKFIGVLVLWLVWKTKKRLAYLPDSI
jgi:uncharacterized PurR-regulated membrane protein YhhQ (DUF165 family)